MNIWETPYKVVAWSHKHSRNKGSLAMWKVFVSQGSVRAHTGHRGVLYVCVKDISNV